MWRSLAARCVRDAEAARSNRATPTLGAGALFLSGAYNSCLPSLVSWTPLYAAARARIYLGLRCGPPDEGR